ncbi:protein translocase subunit SecD [Chlamydia sp. 17-3921]|uniref:protein translocase subunit SecD n=1 Tax=Chlamydia sp. 17-3921 TaxID=2675798 RepID=UPI00191B2D97|nr:protein translocase subunit SecD [Chlamydia sp. 17-3921]
MKRNVRRNFCIIICVFALALYYVLPTCFYYTRPLQKNISDREASRIIKSFVKQSSKACNDVLSRISSSLSALHLKGKVEPHPEIPGVINVFFKQERDAQIFMENLIYGESSVPIKSAKLHVLGYEKATSGTIVRVSGSQISPVIKNDFDFVPYSINDEKKFSEEVFSEILTVFDDFSTTCCCDYSSLWETAPKEQILRYAKQLSSGFEIFPHEHLLSFIKTIFPSDKDYFAFLNRLVSLYEDTTIPDDQLSLLADIQSQLTRLSSEKKISKRAYIEGSLIQCNNVSQFFSSVSFLPKERKVTFIFHPSLVTKKKSLSAEQRLDLDGWLNAEKLRLSKKLNRNLEESPEGFSCYFIDKKTSGRIVLKGERVSQNIIKQLEALVLQRPSAETCDFSLEHFPVHSRFPTEHDSLGCFIFSPQKSCQHFSQGSIYVVFKGLRPILAKYQENPSKEKHAFERDLQNLYNCFSHVEASSRIIEEDQILEICQPLQSNIDVWGESFSCSEKCAFLDVRTVKDRLETLNSIEKNYQNELVRWHELYRQAGCSIDPHEQLHAPIPFRNPLIENFKLNLRKYFRGENALRLGIDFIGGKQLLLAFKDHQGKKLSDKEDILKVSDELYSRLNKLGVSEIEIRREGEYIYLSVPGSAKVSPSDVLGTSKMSFHVVNEKFSPYNVLRYEVQRFLDYLWFSAQSQGEISPEAINSLASHIFYGSMESLPTSVRDAISKLKQEGLAFPSEKDNFSSSEFDTNFSMIAIERDAEGKANPLMIVFRNYALDGASLKDIRPEFASGEGYILNFSVKDKVSSKSLKTASPTESFFAWTSAFCQEGVSGTVNSQYSGNRGWRMAVVLDGYVISSPVLNAPLRNNASVSGKFTHREVSKLAADLKSGVISFVPQVLSEETISSELGKEQGVQGIVSVCLGLAVLIVLMSVYYRFGGVIASFAVLLNLLLIWAALQYLDAPLTMSGLAGIILAMGMAVDANVLVFERIREEFVLSQSLSHSVETGYKKAFGAIFDSNLTTVLASALLLLLDTGPIKGFALTLVLGIFSSMFTALFMTKFFFTIWMRRTQETQLHMMNKFIGIKHDFLKECKKIWIISGSIFALGCVALSFGAWNSVLGMDFKGGYAFTVQAENRDVVDLAQIRKQVTNKLKQAGLSSRDYRIKVLNSSEKLKIYFSQKALSRTHLPKVQTIEISDPELAVAVELLSETGLDVSSEGLKNIQNFWSKVSGQFSNKMRQQALIGLLGALAIILLYVSLRFEWRYAFSAICALLHDLIATCAVLVATHFFLQKIQIDLQAIGALMTVLGYSLNNTLIIFDRIREDRQEKLFTPMRELINDALQKTLSRTVMTTVTTLSVLLILLFVGGGTVFNFAFIMTIGILLGTLSSLYIAPPLLLFMIRKEKSRQ